MSLFDQRGLKPTVTHHIEHIKSWCTLRLSVCVPTGKPLSADQDPGRLLLLRVRAAGGQGRSRPLLRGDGAGHD